MHYVSFLHFFVLTVTTGIAKSCTAEEIDTLKNNASAYADYMERNPQSVISRIYGAYRLQIYGNALYFFVMNNIFLNAEGLPMNEKYDIKVRDLLLDTLFYYDLFFHLFNSTNCSVDEKDDVLQSMCCIHFIFLLCFV